MTSPHIGQVVAGKYRLEQLLGRGGMGSVWAAVHQTLGMRVALKFMARSVADSSLGHARFEREARAAAAIQGPNVVQIHDYGVEDGTPYIVMELLVGEDLHRRLQRAGRLPLRDVSDIVGQVARALRRAHDAGIVHRDLKPANIFLVQNDGEELVKVLDFGLAKMPSAEGTGDATTSGVVLGSAHYMSPEQARGVSAIDHRSDLWALGVVVFRALVGQLPFPGGQMGDVILKICSDPIPRASDLAPDLAPEIDAFLSRALARPVEERFQSARDMAAELAILAGREPVAASVPASLLAPALEALPIPATATPTVTAIWVGPLSGSTAEPLSFPTSDATHLPPPLDPSTLPQARDHAPPSGSTVEPLSFPTSDATHFPPPLDPSTVSQERPPAISAIAPVSGIVASSSDVRRKTRRWGILGATTTLLLAGGLAVHAWLPQSEATTAGHPEPRASGEAPSAPPPPSASSSAPNPPSASAPTMASQAPPPAGGAASASARPRARVPQPPPRRPEKINSTLGF